MPVRDARLGRIAFPTVTNALKETLGDTLEVSGSAITEGERRARPFPLTVPIYGARSDADPYAVGNRLRRQARALIDNPLAKQYGLWFALAPDAEQNGWLRVGGGELSYSEQGGVTLADYSLELTDVYRVGHPRTHRQARRAAIFDKRGGTYPRDRLGVVFGPHYSAIANVLGLVVPTGAYAVTGALRAPKAIESNRVGRDGPVPMIGGVVDGEVVTFEQDEADRLDNDVVAYDRRGASPTQAMTAPGDLNPEGVYGWEEAPGPNYPLTAGDVPTLDNGLCRTRYQNVAGSGPVLRLDRWVAGTGYVECGAVTFGAAATQALREVALVEVSTERTVLRFVMESYSTGGNRYDEVFVTLGRGWTLPRVELYVRGTAGSYVGFVPNNGGTQTFSRAGVAGVTTTTWSYTGASNEEPWWQLANSAHTVSGAYAIPQTIAAQADANVYGATRNGLKLTPSVVIPGVSYASLWLHVPVAGTAGSAIDFARWTLHDQLSIPDLVAR